MLLALLTESTYSTMPVIGCALSSAPALNVTGDASVDPATGEQILTVSLTVELHVCDHAAVPLITTTKPSKAVTSRVL